jgi:hypothetical protein
MLSDLVHCPKCGHPQRIYYDPQAETSGERFRRQTFPQWLAENCERGHKIGAPDDGREGREGQGDDPECE